MAAADRLLDPVLVHLHARAVVAVARADDEMSLEEGLRLRERLKARAGGRVSLDDLLLADPLTRPSWRPRPAPAIRSARAAEVWAWEPHHRELV